MRCELVTYHGENKATFSCPTGHKFRRNVVPLKGRKLRIGEAGVQKLLSWLKSTGVTMDCPKCDKN